MATTYVDLETMKISVSGNTDVGLKRKRNEDSFLVVPEIDLYIVADGMGGHKGGDYASSNAVAILKEVAEKHLENSTYFSPRAMLEEGYSEASRRIYNKSKDPEFEKQGMGTTMVAAFFHEGSLYIGNVGDSRAYLFDDEFMWQLTEDHSLLNEHLKAGLIKDSEIETFQSKNVITRSVGFEGDVRCDIFQRKVQPGDKYLLCSDGLCGLVKDQRIHEIIKDVGIEKSVELCIAEAKKNGGDDNITAVVISVEN